eukprot:306275-Pyramimonas_sp.AAC.1
MDTEVGPQKGEACRDAVDRDAGDSPRSNHRGQRGSAEGVCSADRVDESARQREGVENAIVRMPTRRSTCIISSRRRTSPPSR